MEEGQKKRGKERGKERERERARGEGERGRREGRIRSFKAFPRLDWLALDGMHEGPLEGEKWLFSTKSECCHLVRGLQYEAAL